MPARSLRPTLRALALALIALLIPLSVRAAPPLPRAPERPPVVPALEAPLTRPADATAAPDLPPLKAVLLVGPIDGDYGEATNNSKKAMELAAKELEAHGVAVHRFYAPNSDWEQIKAAANGAHFLYYGGHGVYWSEMPYPDVGGFYLSSRFVSPDDIRDDLKLAPGAIIMLHGACFTAGSSGNDTISVTSAEAQRRVAQYSDPFLDIGAAGYYANWFENALQSFTRALFEGKTLGGAYEGYFDFNAGTVERYRHPAHPEAVMWLDKDDWYEPKPQYNHAFAGQPEATLESLFRGTAMTVSPGQVSYLTTPDIKPRKELLRVDAIGGGSFGWTAASDVSWITLSRGSGRSGETTQLTIRPPALLGLHEGRVKITASDPAVANREQTVVVRARVVKAVRSVFAPVAGE